MGYYITVQRGQKYSGETGSELLNEGDMVTFMVMSYLIDGQHSNKFGLFRIDPAYIAADLCLERFCEAQGLDRWEAYKIAHESLEKLCKIGFCSYDKQTKVIWIRSMVKHQFTKPLKTSDNQVTYIKRSIENLPVCDLVQQFLQEYGEFLSLVGEKGTSLSEIVQSDETEQEEGSAPPSQAPCEGGCEGPFQDPYEAKEKKRREKKYC